MTNKFLSDKIEKLEKEIKVENNCKIKKDFNDVKIYLNFFKITKEIENNKLIYNKENTLNKHGKSDKSIKWNSKIESRIEENSDKIDKLNELFKNYSIYMNKNDEQLEFKKNTKDLENKFSKLSNVERLISQLMIQITNMKENNTIWQGDFLKNMNEFNEKIMNQEILLDSLEKFEKITDIKIENIFFEQKKIQLEMHNDKNEVQFY